MKPLLLTLTLCFSALAQDKTTSTTESQPALTIYNQNFFVAREHLPLDLKSGANHIQYSGISAHIEPDSVILRDPAGTRIPDPRAELPQRSRLAGTLTVVLRRQDHRISGSAGSDREGENHSQRLRAQLQQRQRIPAAARVQPAHHRSRWRAALRSSRPAVVSLVKRRLHPEANLSWLLKRTSPARSTPNFPTSAVA